MIDKSTSDNIKILGVVMTAAIVMHHCGATASSSVEGGAIDLWLNDHVSIAFNQIGILAMSYFFTVAGFLLFSGLSYGKIPLKSKKRELRRSLFRISYGSSSQLATMLR